MIVIQDSSLQVLFVVGGQQRAITGVAGLGAGSEDINLAGMTIKVTLKMRFQRVSACDRPQGHSVALPASGGAQGCPELSHPGATSACPRQAAEAAAATPCTRAERREVILQRRIWYGEGGKPLFE